VRSRPVIGIATQTLDPVSGEPPAAWFVGQCYVRALTEAGALPWLIPLLSDDEATLRGIYDRLDGVFLAGGVDVDPALYGEERHALCDRPDPARDATEMALVRWAAAEDKPLLGVCRGIQAINVACGGSLYQHVAEQHPRALKHDWFSSAGHPRDHLAHEVHLRPGSRLARVLGAEVLPVNSMHHQGVRRLAPGLVVAATAPDGLIEAVERPGCRYFVGVQWHPEELTRTQPAMRRLFADFIDASAGRA
jgi:putative glutamine amidotransferase